MAEKKTWFVTGCSKGMGNVLARRLLEEGYRVAATSRAVDSLVESIGHESEAFLPLAMDVTDEADVARAVTEAEAKFGRIDVLVNNAGYTHLATIEELSDADARAVFGVNVFGPLNCIRAVLPGMRERGCGHIFDVSSLGAYNVGPLSGVYCATKHAVKAISETLAQELAGTGVRVTDVKPGFIRTEFFGGSYKTTAPEGSPYAALYEENMAFYKGQDGNQAGDPAKVAQLYIECAEMEKPWESLPMGTDCCTGIRDICAGTVALMDAMLPVARTTDYDGAADAACASNIATVQRYFELCDLADQSQASFDALIALYADDCESRSNDGSVSRGKAELVANTARFYDWTRGGEHKHLYNVTRAEGDVVEADWAVSARIPDGAMVALKGHNVFELDADHRIRKLAVENV